MNKETNKNIPELRFPEFVEDGEWVEKRFGDIGEFLGGGTPSRSNSEYWIGNIPWISSSDISEEDIHNISISQFINEEAVKASATKIIPKGSILFVSRVGVGKLAINKKAELCTSQDFTNFLPTKVLNYFIAYYFSANKNLLKSLSQGTSIQGFSKSDLEDFKIGYPVSSEEQQKIANCLSSLDEVIAAHSQKLELLKEHKKGLMQNLFPQEGETVPKYRFPEFNEKWKKTKLIEHIDLLSGYAFQSIFFSEKGKRLLTPKNFTKNGTADFFIENTKYTTEDFDKKYLCGENDLLLLLTDLTPSCELLGKPVMLKKDDGEVLLNQRIAKVLFKSDINRFFLLQFFLTDSFHRRIKDTASGSTVRHSSIKIVLDTVISFPPNPIEQQKIAECLSSSDSLITAQSNRVEQLKLHKKGLMQGLFPKVID